MRLLLALLLGNAAANPLISLVSKAKKLATAKNLGLGAVTPVIAGGLNTLREAAGDAEDKRQGVKASLESCQAGPGRGRVGSPRRRAAALQVRRPLTPA